jgi:hypothetical protein
VLAFGLPRVPHGFALQVMAVGDRFVLQKFRSVAEVGVYSMGVSFGLIPKIALGAFESAWAPFYYATSREPDAKRVLPGMPPQGPGTPQQPQQIPGQPQRPVPQTLPRPGMLPPAPGPQGTIPGTPGKPPGGGGGSSI